MKKVVFIYWFIYHFLFCTLITRRLIILEKLVCGSWFELYFCVCLFVCVYVCVRTDLGLRVLGLTEAALSQRESLIWQTAPNPVVLCVYMPLLLVYVHLFCVFVCSISLQALVPWSSQISKNKPMCQDKELASLHHNVTHTHTNTHTSLVPSCLSVSYYIFLFLCVFVCLISQKHWFWF